MKKTAIFLTLLLSATLLFAQEKFPAKRVMEHFTASTCPPCATYNAVLNPMYQAHEGDFVILKYPANWPGSGDPYYTTESRARISYYNVSSVPSLFRDGKSYTLYYAPGTTTIDTARIVREMTEAKTSDYKIELESSSINLGSELKFTVNVTSLVPVDAAKKMKLRVFIEEKTTYDNVGTNGETEFHYLHMKTFETDFVVSDINTPFTFSSTFDMSETHMEEEEDLSIVAFIQSDITKEIFQAMQEDVNFIADQAFVKLNSIHVSPYMPNESKQPVMIMGSMRSRGLPVTSVDLTARVGGASGNQETIHFDIPEEMTKGEDFTFTCSPKISMEGEQQLEVWVSKVNGEAFDGTKQVADLNGIAATYPLVPLLEGFILENDQVSDGICQTMDAISEENASWNAVKFPLDGKYYRADNRNYQAKNGYAKGEAGMFLNGFDMQQEFLTEDILPDILADITTLKTPVVVSDVEAYIQKQGDIDFADITFKVTSEIDNLKAWVFAFLVEKDVDGTTHLVQAISPSGVGLSVQLVKDSPRSTHFTKKISKSTLQNLDNLEVVIVVREKNTLAVLQSFRADVANKTAVEETVMGQRVNIYPNPATEVLHFAGLEAITGLQIVDLAGRIVMNVEGVEGNYSMNISGLKAGNYVVKVINGKNVVVEKLSVVR